MSLFIFVLETFFSINLEYRSIFIRQKQSILYRIEKVLSEKTLISAKLRLFKECK